ncbi:glycogenin-1 isoform X2 [Musca domestica]|uniref:glycogenin glucosyltransferase n=1 Tax=Musca domestica TaxID=7370 RepID=A0A1I8M6H3_MUSDO|nr:glycogenin-1 isoform X2 [Musca domestica]
MSKFAWVTLTTNDTYSLGALVLAHSLRRAGTVHQLAVLVTPGVSESMREKLKDVYNVVQEVNIMDSQDAANLALLSRPELGITFTKLHCWRLVQFEKCVFLDSDTLVLQNCDELFEREEFSAAPDVSWPDCFNSGVFVFQPSQTTYDKIVEFALKNGSFDGGDQGLLNQYFADWATSDIKKRLPFLYNVTAYASYCYLPAFKQFRDKIKILHFAGKMKPWLMHYNSQSKVASVPTDYSHANDLIQMWWNIFFDHVHAQLNTNMRYTCPSLIPWKSNYDSYRYQQHQQQMQYLQEQQQHEYNNNYNQYKEHIDTFYENKAEIKFHDPWEDYYRKQEREAELQRRREEAQLIITPEPENNTHYQHQHYSDNNSHSHYHEERQEEQEQSTRDYEEERHHWSNESENQSFNREPEKEHYHIEIVPNQEHTDAHCEQREEEREHNYHEDNQDFCEQNQQHNENEEREHEQEYSSHEENKAFSSSEECQCNREAESDNNCILHSNDNDDIKNIDNTVNESTQVPTSSDNADSTADQLKDHEAGLAGALSQLRLGEPRTPEQEAYEHLMRRQCWESGQVDYMGRDSFDNIWKRITQTLENKPADDDKTGSS